MRALPFKAPKTLGEFNQFCRDHFAEFSPQHQLALRYMIDNPNEVPLTSMRTLAARTGVQPAALVRLAQRLGFNGWQALRSLFVEELRNGHLPYAARARNMVRTAHDPSLLDSIVQTQLHNLDALRRHSSKDLSAAARILHRAKSVYVAGFRACFPVAFTFHYVCRLFRPTVQLIRAEAGTLEMELRGMSSDDALLVISFAPYSQEALQTVQAAVDAGCKIIALTDSSLSPLALRAERTVLFPVESPSFFPSISTGILAAEALAQQLLALDGKVAVKALEATEGQLTSMGAYAPVDPTGQRPPNAEELPDRRTDKHRAGRGGGNRAK